MLASRVLVMIEHATQDGSEKFKTKCRFALTDARVVGMPIADPAVFSPPTGACPLR